MITITKPERKRSLIFQVEEIANRISSSRGQRKKKKKKRRPTTIHKKKKRRGRNDDDDDVRVSLAAGV